MTRVVFVAAIWFWFLPYMNEARAGGPLVPGAGPHPQARAGAFVARADDLNALLHNPAGLAKLDGTQIMLGANFVNYDLKFTRLGRYEAPGEPYEGLPYPTVEERSKPELGIGEYLLIPAFGVSSDLGNSEWPLRFAIGLAEPQAYGPRRFDRVVTVSGVAAPAPQRYDTVDQEAIFILPSVGVAYSPLDSLDVGIRLTWGYAKFGGTRTVWPTSNYSERRTDDSEFTLTNAVDRFVPSYGLGVLYRPSDRLEFGLQYSGEITARATGNGQSEAAILSDGTKVELDAAPDANAACAPGGTMNALKTCIEVQLARNATLGGRYIFRDGTGAERADVELNVRWEDWSAASDTKMVVDAFDTVSGGQLHDTFARHGFRDVFGVNLGGSYTQPMGAYRLIGRAGGAYDTAASPDSFTRVDLDGKQRVTLAAGLAFEGSWFRFELGGGVVLEPDITVESCKGPDGPSDVDAGCGENGFETPVDKRTQPSPIQPKLAPNGQRESPFNGGTYRSGYVLLSSAFSVFF